MTDFKDYLTQPGEHFLLLPGVKGRIEAVLSVPEAKHSAFAAVIGHPHPLQEGTMNNKVVTTLARIFKELGIAALRFNFRGVGSSDGDYDEGIGESEDMLSLAKMWQTAAPHLHFIFAGFSFGSYVAYRAAAQVKHTLLITVAPPVHHYNYSEFEPPPENWIIAQGDDDEVVPITLVEHFALSLTPPLPVLCFENTGHFFHGKLMELKSRLIESIRERVTTL